MCTQVYRCLWQWNQARINQFGQQSFDLEGVAEFIAFSMTSEFEVLCDNKTLSKYIVGYQNLIFGGILYQVQLVIFQLTSIGILKERQGQYYFMHKIFQEYLTGTYLAENPLVLKEKLNEPQFSDSIVLWYQNRVKELIPIIDILPDYIWISILQRNPDEVPEEIVGFLAKDFNTIPHCVSKNILVPLFQSRLFEKRVMSLLLNYCYFYETKYGIQKRELKTYWNMFHATDEAISGNTLLNIANTSSFRQNPVLEEDYWPVLWEIPIQNVLARIFATSLIHHLTHQKTANQASFRQFYKENLRSGKGELIYFTVIQIDTYFYQWKDLEFFEYLKTNFSNKHFFMDDSIREIEEQIGDIEYDLSGNIEVEIAGIKDILAENDWRRAIRLLSSFSEPALPLQLIAQGVLEQLTNLDLLNIARVALLCPKFDDYEWQLQEILDFLGRQESLTEDLIAELIKYSTYIPSESSVMRTEKWTGVRLRAVSALCSNLDERKVSGLIDLYENSNSFDLKLFFIAPLYAVMGNFATLSVQMKERITLLANGFVEEVSQCADLQLFLEGLQHVRPALSSYQMSVNENILVGIDAFIEKVISDIPRSHLMHECFGWLERAKKDNSTFEFQHSPGEIFRLLLEIGDSTYLPQLKNLYNIRPDYFSEIAKIRSHWTNQL